jgi:cysteinyl-tRNA synthetase
MYAAIEGLKLDRVDASDYIERFNEAMDDDFNTPEALAVLFDMVREINRLKEAGHTRKASGIAAGLKQLTGLLGILNEDPTDFLRGDTADLDVAKIEALIAERKQARSDKNWSRADEIRDELTKMKIVILDSKEGATWRHAD